LWFVAGLAAGGGVVAAVLLARHVRVAADASRLAAERDAALRSADEQRALLAQAQSQLRESFSALSRDALRENRTDFLSTADALLRPVRETLDRVQTQLADVDKAREGSFRAVSSQITSLTRAHEQLRSAADGLSQSLRSPNVRGRWGEIQLRRIVELAGMLEQCDFIEKLSGVTAQGARQTPDLIVKLPGDTNIVIDAKVPITAYLEAMQAKNDGERADLIAAHTRQVRDHIRALGHKEYARQFQPAPEFVVMFLPLEPLLAAAFEQDGTLLEFAASQRVIPATPMTLLALLKAVAHGWKQQQIARNTEEIQQLGRELYERLATVVDHLESVGRNIRQAAESYDRFVGSLETKVLPGARRLKDLGVTSAREIAEPDLLNLDVRRVTKEELTTERSLVNGDW
jgi:DNA recombination protein RmuC